MILITFSTITGSVKGTQIIIYTAQRTDPRHFSIFEPCCAFCMVSSQENDGRLVQPLSNSNGGKQTLPAPKRAGMGHIPENGRGGKYKRRKRSEIKGSPSQSIDIQHSS